MQAAADVQYYFLFTVCLKCVRVASYNCTKHVWPDCGGVNGKKQLLETCSMHVCMHVCVYMCVVWCDVMSCHVMSRCNPMYVCAVMSCDHMWCHVMWCLVMWCDVMWCEHMWCGVMSCHGCHVMICDAFDIYAHSPCCWGFSYCIGLDKQLFLSHT